MLVNLNDVLKKAQEGKYAVGLFNTTDHNILLPANVLCGAALALLCNFIARMPGFEGALPINSVTSLIGAPIALSILLKKKRNLI